MVKKNELAKLDNVEFPVNFKPAEISFDGYDDFKNKVVQLHDNLDGYVVTKDNLKDATDTKNKLSKAKKAINEERKRITKQAEAPVKEFKKRVDGLLDIVDDSYSQIYGQIKDFEKQERQAKHEANLKMISDMCELAGVDKDGIEYNSSWDTKSFSKTKFENEVDSQIAILKQRQETKAEAITAVSQRADKLALPSEHWINELKTKLLPDVLNAMDEYKAELNQISKKQHETKVQEIKDLKKRGDILYDPETGEVKEKIYTATIKVTGTKFQIQALNSFLRDNAIKAERIKGGNR